MPRPTDMPIIPGFVVADHGGEVAHLTTTCSSRILDADSAASRLLGRPLGTLVHKPLAALVDMDDRRVFRSRLAALADDGGVENWRLRLAGRDGHVVAVVASVRTIPATQGIEPTLAWTLVADETAMSTAGRATAAVGDRAAFEHEMAQLVHELNQPLAAITTFVRGIIIRMRQQKLTNEDLESALEALSEEARRASGIVRAAGRRWESPT